MYAYLKGTLVEATPTEVVIDVQGVGYQLFIPVSHFGKLPQIGGSVLLHTSFVVREMSQTLYGFLTKEARDLFNELITVTGIGPKTGLSIIGHLSVEELQEAVRRHDSACLAKVPGIGKKTAERLLIELQGRLRIQTVWQQVPEPSNRLNDALRALLQLGYSQTAAEKAVKKAADSLPDNCELSTLVTAALKHR